MSELKLITPRRNFLIRALGFTAAGATLPISIIAADDAGARIAHHQTELERTWRDYRRSPMLRGRANTGRDLCFARKAMAGPFIVHDMRVGRRWP